MSLLSELKTLLSPVLPVETGVFSGKAPDKYVVLVPMGDDFPLFADDFPIEETQAARISVFDKGNYNQTKNNITKILLQNEITVTDRTFVEHEKDTGYFHYAIDVEKNYNFNMEE